MSVALIEYSLIKGSTNKNSPRGHSDCLWVLGTSGFEGSSCNSTNPWTCEVPFQERVIFKDT